MNQASFPQTSEHARAEGGTRRGFWMRAVRFAGLHRILSLVAEYQDGIRAGELNREIIARELYCTDRGTPAKSTLYHCRNTLLQLGAIHRSHGRLFASVDNPTVSRLLREAPPAAAQLTETARYSFSTLVLCNEDCSRHFFRLFAPSADALSPRQFAARAKPVVWLQTRSTENARKVELRSTAPTDSIALTCTVQIQSVLYGVRYWARDQLGLIDEFFETGRGSVMYPIRSRPSADSAGKVMERILALPRDPGDWTTFSLNALLRLVCEAEGHPVRDLYDGIRCLLRQHSGHVSLIPTIPSIAAMSATSHHREEFELRGYFVDSHGRIISHIRFHNSL